MIEHLDPDVVSSVAAGGTAAAVSRVIVSIALKDFDEFKKKTFQEIEKCKESFHVLDKVVHGIKTKQEIDDDQRRDKKSTRERS